MKSEKIALLTTVANFDLYEKTSRFFPNRIQKFVIDGRNGMHGIHSIKFMMKKLKGRGIEWLVMCDEDVIFTRPDEIFGLIKQMTRENFTACGIRDGGVIAHRRYNPLVINTFFSIINFKEVEAIWNKNVVSENHYIQNNEFGDNLSSLQHRFDSQSLYEPYYGFYLWLRRLGKKFLFLESEMMDDGITNSILFQKEPIAYHTWYARSYGKNEKHTRRIDSFLAKITDTDRNPNNEDPIVFKRNTFAIEQKFTKYYKRFRTKFLK
jgi:hypothetical protein